MHLKLKRVGTTFLLCSIIAGTSGPASSTQTVGEVMQAELNQSAKTQRQDAGFWVELETQYLAKIEGLDPSAVSVTFSPPKLASPTDQNEIAQLMNENYKNKCMGSKAADCGENLKAFFVNDRYDGQIFVVTATVALKPEFYSALSKFLSGGSSSTYLMRAKSEEGPMVNFTTDPNPDNMTEFSIAVRAPEKDTSAAVPLRKTGNIKFDQEAALLSKIMGAATTEAYAGYTLPDISDANLTERIFSASAERKTKRNLQVLSTRGGTVASIGGTVTPALLSKYHQQQWGQHRYRITINQGYVEQTQFVVPRNQITSIARLSIGETR